MFEYVVGVVLVWLPIAVIQATWHNVARCIKSSTVLFIPHASQTQLYCIFHSQTIYFIFLPPSLQSYLHIYKDIFMVQRGFKLFIECPAVIATHLAECCSTDCATLSCATRIHIIFFFQDCRSKYQLYTEQNEEEYLRRKRCIRKMQL